MFVALKVIHIYALLVGAAGGLGTAVLMSRADGPPSPQVAATLGIFRKFGVGGVIVLWLTGPAMAYMQFGTLALGTVFNVKLLAATVMLALILGSAWIATRPRPAGTPPPVALLSRLGQLGALAALVAVVCAVYVFH